MDPLKLVSKNTLFLMLGEIAGKLISFLVTLAFVRYLGQESLGKFAIAMAYLFFFSVIPYFAHESILARELAVREKEKGGEWLGAAIALRAILSVAALLLAWGGMLFARYPEEIRFYVWIATWMLLASFRYLFVAVFQKTGEMGLYAVASNVVNLVAAVGMLLLIALGAGVACFLWWQVGMCFFAGGWYFFLAQSRLPCRWRWERGTFASLLRSSAPLTVGHLFDRVLARMDQMILFALAGAAALGAYSAAVTWVEALWFVPGSVVTALLPVLSAFYGNEPEKHRLSVEKSSKFLAMVAFPATLSLSFFSAPIIDLVFGAEYAASAPVLRILAWSLPLVFLLILLRYALISSHRQKMVLWGGLAGALLNIPLNIFLVQQWGAIGAAVGTTLAYLAPIVCFSLDAVSREAVKGALKGMLAVVPAAAGMALCLWGIPLHWIGALVVGWGAFGGLLVWSGGLRREEWQLLRRAWSRGLGEMS